MTFDALILGGGAAGLMCAIEAGKRGRRVAVLERADRLGKKILISGGGRCNFTNLHCQPENFLSSNPHFAKSALARYTPQDFIALVEKHGIPYHEKTLGQLFCDHSAGDILTMRWSAAKRAFRGDTTADTISSILKEEPPDLSASGRDVSPMLERIVHHCLEKDPAARFQSARDVAFALEALSSVSSSVASAVAIPAPAIAAPPSRKSWLVPSLLGVIAVLIVAVALLMVRVNAPA